jgi:cystathionine beta-lyase/cystathionine gamma-synthase
MLAVTDIAAASDIAHRHGVRVVVDNTFASPYIQRPLTLGADIVLHSTTKFLNGHSDSVGGIVIVRHDDDVEWMRFVQNAAGAILGPMDAWLVLRGTKTLPIRMERTNANTMRIAEFLAAHPRVTRTIYPGLPSHPHHALASRQMQGFGGLISFDVGSLERSREVLGKVRLMALAESLGGVFDRALPAVGRTSGAAHVHAGGQPGLHHPPDEGVDRLIRRPGRKHETGARVVFHLYSRESSCTFADGTIQDTCTTRGKPLF